MTEQRQFPERNFMVEVSHHKTHEKNKFYPDGDYLFATSWLSQKHPYGYRVDYFSTLEDAQSAIEKCKIANPQKEGYWLTFTIYSITDVTRSRPAPAAPARYLPISLDFQPICIDKPCIGQIDICPVDDECDSVKQCIEHRDFLRENPDIAEHNRKIISQHDAAIRNATLDAVITHCKERSKEYPDDETYVDSEMDLLEEWIEESLRQQAGERK